MSGLTEAERMAISTALICRGDVYTPPRTERIKSDAQVNWETILEQRAEGRKDASSAPLSDRDQAWVEDREERRSERAFWGGAA